MSQLLEEPAGAGALLGKSFKNYLILYKALWPLILVSALIHVFVPFVSTINKMMGYVFLAFVTLVTWYLYAAILYRGYRTLQGFSEKHGVALALAWQRYLTILGGNIVFLFIGGLLVSLGYGLFYFGSMFGIQAILVLILLIFSVFVVVIFYFALPLIVLDGSQVFKAFERSVHMVWGKWWHSFAVLIVMFAILFLIATSGFSITRQASPATSILFSIIGQLVSYPIAVSITLVLFNDLKLRFARCSLDEASA